MCTVIGWRSLRHLTALLLLTSILSLGCSDEEQGDLIGDDQTIRDLDRDVPDEPGQTDTAADGNVASDAPDSQVGADGLSTDVAADPVSDAPGPDNLSVACESHGECPGDGYDPGVCCTEALFYRSYCSTLAVCGAGGRDACLTDDQCAARDSERPYCCHDRNWYHYCAPSRETCTPLEPCDSYQDCGVENRDCCSLHEYYLVPMCTTEFFAANPATDCPP